MSIPKDPVMLLSYINTELRDNFDSLTALCRALDLDEAALTEKLAAIDYHYDASTNSFR